MAVAAAAPIGVAPFFSFRSREERSLFFLPVSCQTIGFLTSTISFRFRSPSVQKRFRLPCQHCRSVVAVSCLNSSSSSSSSLYPSNNAAAPTTKLYVSGLSFRTTEESLRNAFKNFGELVEVNLVMDRRANRPRGFAFLHYATEEESKKAIEGMHGKFLDGRVIFVEVARPRSELPPRFNQSPRQY